MYYQTPFGIQVGLSVLAFSVHRQQAGNQLGVSIASVSIKMFNANQMQVMQVVIFKIVVFSTKSS